MSMYRKGSLSLADFLDNQNKPENADAQTSMGTALKVFGAVRKFRGQLKKTKALHSVYVSLSLCLSLSLSLIGCYMSTFLLFFHFIQFFVSFCFVIHESTLHPCLFLPLSSPCSYRNFYRYVHLHPDTIPLFPKFTERVDWNDEDSAIATFRLRVARIFDTEPSLRSKEDIDFLVFFLRECSIIRRLEHSWGKALLPHLIRVMSLQRLESGSTVYRQGEVGATAYIIISGTVKLTKGAGGGKRQEVASLGCKESFGELALISVREGQNAA